ncbi:elongation factor P maturation arginine rhamnosyltransferase EarP [Hydrogenophaga sp.]|uniref:elongation factor P maturation arginine rhamnosyltransferase EarP n=1 Tax=Hydrogenophaga sp. TaxID=1904254 RepID=UPI00271C9E5D|nr:elongation factor P maturation arginine rhamnosyltransferase EarP [Hydrogenophaga sp.]MDO8904748.1 elongation factor P maturation arginine rhamnosyltransferase EarP [Hydrogenophaga sp.]
MHQPTVAPQANRDRPLWDVFCRVVDNLGDIGVCWRLAANLADRGQQVRLWIDQPEPLRWMAPGALDGTIPWIEVIPWKTPLPAGLCDSLAPAHVWVEAFGCHPPDEAQHALKQQLASGAVSPVWINLEYLSAESYVERSHGLPSPVMSGPLKGIGKWFFYPGFTSATGGLLREADLGSRQAGFDATVWLRQMKLPASPAKRVSVFCYEPAALDDLLCQASETNRPVQWLVAPGRSALAVHQSPATEGLQTAGCLHYLPPLPQQAFDHLLWACDLNLVRGEDSLVRAIWAGKPFVWHIYPQHDNAHHAKLDAFLDWLEAPLSLRRFHHVWNGMNASASHWPGWDVVNEWQGCVQAARSRLWSQRDLGTQLIEFAFKNR